MPHTRINIIINEIDKEPSWLGFIALTISTGLGETWRTPSRDLNSIDVAIGVQSVFTQVDM